MFIKNPLFQEGGELLLLKVFFLVFLNIYSETFNLLITSQLSFKLERTVLTKSSTNTNYAHPGPVRFFSKGLKGNFSGVYWECVKMIPSIWCFKCDLLHYRLLTPKFVLKSLYQKYACLMHLSFSILTLWGLPKLLPFFPKEIFHLSLDQQFSFSVLHVEISVCIDVHLCTYPHTYIG